MGFLRSQSKRNASTCGLTGSIKSLAKLSETYGPTAAGNCLVRCSFVRRGCYADSFIGSAVVKQPTLRLEHGPLHENHVGNLSNFLPFLFWSKHWLLRTRQNFSGILLVEQRPPSGIHEFLVGSVVDQK